MSVNNRLLIFKSVFIFIFLGGTIQLSFSQTPFSELEISTAGYPRAFIFWQNVRDLLANPGLNTQQLDAELMKLNGICIPSNNWTKVVAFKKRHPEMLTYLFIQGSVVAESPCQYDPFVRKDFYDGHWVYFVGSKVTGDLTPSQTVISVQNAALVKAGEDVAICSLKSDGKPDWNICEQVKCVSVDAVNNTITVLRAQYGSTARTFVKDQTWAAAHAYWNWGYPGANAISWTINYSTTCPKDPQGKTIADILHDKLSAYFLPGGELECFDGLEFDLCYGKPTSTNVSSRSYDTNGDGIADGGIFNGKNEFGIGLANFHANLRNTLGPDKVILGDGAYFPNLHERRYDVLNGVETEWWPDWGDMDITYWSTGNNFHHFLKQNSYSPYFSYFNHKVGGESRAQGLAVPFKYHRLVFAAAQFTDAVLTTHPNCLPRAEAGNLYTIWDEFVKGVEKRRNWLGMPMAPAMRIALSQTDLLNGEGQTITDAFLQKFQGAGLTFTRENGGVRVSASIYNTLKFSINNIPCTGADLFLSFNMTGSSRVGYPTEYVRPVTLTSSSGSPEQSFFINTKLFNSCLSFRGVTGSSVNLSFDISGGQSVWISNFTAYAYPDATYRLFENGLVIANPADHNYEFNLAEISPGTQFRRLQGSSLQDIVTNNGTLVGPTVVLGARDALFLVKDGSSDIKDRNSEAGELMVYPNPCAKYLDIGILNKFQPIDYKIHDITGNLVESGTINPEQSRLELNFPNGIYIISVYGQHQVYRSRFIKQ